MTPIRGGCLCGAVRFQSAAPPLTARICWCRVCQYLGAGSGTVNVGFPTEGFETTGTTREFRSVADSGNVMRRRFCGECGTPLFSSAEARPQVVFVRAGSLDDPNLAQPSVTIWTASAPAWACISESMPRVAGQPPPAG